MRKTFENRIMKQTNTIITTTIVPPMVTTQATGSPLTTTIYGPPYHPQNFFIINESVGDMRHNPTM